MPRGIDQVAAQVANRLYSESAGFSRDGKVTLFLPELQAARKNWLVFKICLQARVRAIRPGLALERFELSLEGAQVRFAFGLQET